MKFTGFVWEIIKMANLVSATDIKLNDIIALRGKPDFQRPGGFTYGVVREKITALGDPKTVAAVIVFEIVPDTLRARLPSGLRLERLNDKNIAAYGISGAASWSVIIDPIGVDIDEDHYFLSRTGTLRGDDINTLRARIAEIGESNVNFSGIGPRGMPTQSSLANLPSLPEGTPKRGYVRDQTFKPRRLTKAERGGLPNVSLTVDLPLQFAGKVTDLDPRIIDALLKQGITTLRAAKDLASAQDKLDAVAASASHADLTIEDAIAQGVLPAHTYGLNFVVDPIHNSGPKLTTLKDIYDRAQNNGEGFNAYIGLASKTAKARASLVTAAMNAWEKLQSAPTDSTHAIARQIQKAWGQATTDYLNNVRPYLNDKDLTKIIAPEKIDAKYMHDGNLIFTFPKITGPK